MVFARYAAHAFVAVLFLFWPHSAAADSVSSAPDGIGIAPPPGYVGSSACASCHPREFETWHLSQHARAMQVASEATVLGDFNDVWIEHFGSAAHFFRRDNRFLIETDGHDGRPAEYEVLYTFGLDPLQQYLVAFPDGRIQALPFAWDIRPADRGGQRWFHLYPGEAIPYTDSLHWTGLQQNWNYMCAECHSTGVRKNYDADANRFATTFSEISVGCEACHGPAGGHVQWASGARSTEMPNKGFMSKATIRPDPDWTPDPATGSPAHGVGRLPGDEVETCGRCHGRRGQFSEAWMPGRPLADTHLPSYLAEGLFETDGQMLDEVYNYASFQQSLMYARGVVCTDCHDPHSAKLKAPPAEVCAQCHLPARFATVEHTGHAPGLGAPDCISCHMPARTYMVIDSRHDHGFRIPRPDLTVTLGTPNACNGCHSDKTAGWAASIIESWHGHERKGLQTYGAAFHAARTGAPQARELLLRVVRDADAPSLARATTMLELNALPSAEVDLEIDRALLDPDPMVRIAALRGTERSPIDERWRRAADLLSDPIRAVRIEAANVLADQATDMLTAAERERYDRAAVEFMAAERVNSDRPENRANLGNFLARRGQRAEAQQEYLAGINLQPTATPLYVNLADLYRSQGRESEAEQVLRQALLLAPDDAAVQHSLGLAMIRQKRYAEAIPLLEHAAVVAPDQPRYAYVYAIALQSTGQMEKAHKVLVQALVAHPGNVEILLALLDDAIKGQDAARALAYAERLRPLLPDDPGLAQLIDQLDAAISGAP
ncbi:MAG: cytochrome c3 family protein [Dongiaceae bacterium]